MFRTVAVLSSAAMVSADLMTIKQNFIGLVKNSTMQIPGSGDTRSFESGWASEMIDAINEYGCWCYFQENGSGRGPPANEVDSQCKKLQDGYTCIILDAEAEGDECTPWDVPYNSGTGLGLVADDPENNNNANSLRKSCARANRFDDCAQRSCIVESFFVMQVFRQFLAGVQFDPSLKHSLGNWVPKEDCPINLGIDAEKECCGTYPHRFPFKLETLYGARNCCGELTYNPDVMECCAGNVIKMTC